MINNVVLMGRLTDTPELKYTRNDTATVTFDLAVERSYKPKDTDRITDFIRCVAWRQTAEFISRHFAKGAMIALTGEIQVRKWADNDGKNRYATEVVVREASFTGERRSDGAKPVQSERAGPVTLQANDDDLPF